MGYQLLLADVPIEHFQNVTQIVLTLDNQKNAIQGESVSHFLSESAAACPVQVWVNIFLQMRGHGCPGSTSVSDYPTAQGFRLVSALYIIAVLWADTIQVGAARLGFVPEDVRTPSLRSVGAMAMHLANVPDWTLMAIGWWRSLVFVVCIQQQISSFSAGVSVQMSWQPWFQHT